MIAVVDASAAIEIVLHRHGADRLGTFLQDADYVIAPDLYVAEVSNALWKCARETEGDGFDPAIVDDAVALPDDLVPARSLYREAFALSVERNHPVYDCLYLIVARRNNATLVTLDARLTSLAEAERVAVFGG